MSLAFRISGRIMYRFTMPVIDSNMYVLTAENSCLVVDPTVSTEAERILQESNVEKCVVLLTHEHYDHISGVNWLKEKVKCEVVCSKICAQRIRDPKKNSAAYFDALFLNRTEQIREKVQEITKADYYCQADVTYVGRLNFEWMGLRIEMGEAPGHSPGSQIIRVNEKYYFTGDYLIPGEPVITRFPGGSKRKYEAVTKPYLQDIEPESLIFPGHGNPGVYSEIVGRNSGV